MNKFALISFIIPIFYFSSYGKMHSVKLGVGSLPVPSELPHVRSINKTQVLRQIYDSIFYISETGVLKSNYFSKWKIDKKRKQIILTKVSSIYYSNNLEIKIEDLIAVINRNLESGKKILPEIEFVEKINQSSIKIQLKYVSARFLDKLTDISFIVYSEKYDQFGFPIGSGIFKIKSANNSLIQLERNILHPDFKTGNINYIDAIQLKSTYKLEELLSTGIDFFPLTHIADTSKKSPLHNRVVYPTHRISVIVLNISDMNIRTALSYCIDTNEILKLPYFANEVSQYFSIIPKGVENYQPPKNHQSSFDSKKCKSKLKSLIKNTKKLKWINAYNSDLDSKFINEITSKINQTIGSNVIEVNHLPLNEAQEILKSGAFDIFVCSLSSPIPTVDGIFSDFVYQKGRTDTLVKIEDTEVQKKFIKLQMSELQDRASAIYDLENEILSKKWVLPIGIKKSVFYIPKKWQGLSMINGMNGNYYLGKVRIDD